MTGVLASLVTPALFTLAGFGWTRSCSALRDAPLLERLAYGFLLGVVIVTISIFGCSFLLGLESSPLLTGGVIAAAVAVSSVRARAVRTADAEDSTPVPRRRWSLALAAVAVLTLGLSLIQPPAGWDFRMTWAAHARFIHQDRSVLPDALIDPEVFVAHPRYPPLTSLMQVVAYHVGGATDDCLVTPTYAAFFVSFVVLLFFGVWRLTSSETAAALTAAVPLVIPWFLFSEAGALNGYADFPLACYFGAALVLSATSKPCDRTGVVVGLCLVAGAYTKNEGIALALVYVLAAMLHFSRRREYEFARQVGVATVVCVALLIPLAAWAARLPQRYDEDYASSLLSGKWLSRIPELVTDVLPTVGRVAFKPAWVCALVVSLAALWLSRAAPVHRWTVFLLTAWALGSVVYLVAYTVAPPDADFAALVAVTWERLQLQISFPWLLVLGTSLAGCREERTIDPHTIA